MKSSIFPDSFYPSIITEDMFVIRQLEARKSGHFRFFSEMIKFRRSRRAFGRENFIGMVNLRAYLSVKIVFLTSSHLRALFWRATN